MPAQRESDVGAGACVAEGGGDADCEDCRVLRLRGAGGVVIHETYGGTAKVGGGV